MDESVLVARPGALGDTILTLPLLGSVRALHPKAKITLLGSRAYKDLIPERIEFRPIDAADSLALFSRDENRQPFRPFDRAYVILNNPDEIVSNLRRSGTSEILFVNSRCPDGVHIVEHLAEGLGLSIPGPGPWAAHMKPGKRSDVIWIHPGSGGRRKCVPLKILIDLVDGLRPDFRPRIAVTLGEADDFVTADSDWERLAVAEGRLVYRNMTLAQICAELGGARLYVGNDPGISHLAAGMGIISILFFTVTDPAQWAPWVQEDQMRIVDLRSGIGTGQDLAERIGELGEWVSSSGILDPV